MVLRPCRHSDHDGLNVPADVDPVFAAQPGIFTYAGPNNLPYGAVISAANGSYVTPSNLAQRGQTYYIILTGLGQTNPPLTTNSAGIAGENVVPTLIVGVNNSGVAVPANPPTSAPT